jgi:hypothetical protein
VDATTRPGMSGAPVIVRLLTITGAPYQARLVGIYTGRLGMKDGDSALGKVFKPRVINEIAEGGKKYVYLYLYEYQNPARHFHEQRPL